MFETIKKTIHWLQNHGVVRMVNKHMKVESTDF